MWTNTLVIYRFFLCLTIALLISCGKGSDPAPEVTDTDDNVPPNPTAPPPSQEAFDYVNLTVGINLSKAHIEDSSALKPQIRAFQNPVGLLDNIVFQTPYPGFHITLENTVSGEQFVLAIDSPSTGSFDKTQSTAIYRMPSGEYYRLDDSDSNTTLNISLEKLGILGEHSQGDFNAVLCKDSVIVNQGDCSIESNQLPIAGTFLVTTEDDKTYRSFSADNPKVLDEYVAENPQQMSTESSHYQLLATVGSIYKVRAISSNASVGFEISSSHNGVGLIESSTANAGNTEQSATFTAESTTPSIAFSYTGDSSGATFVIEQNALSAAAQGSETTPLAINTGGVFFDKPGQVDNTASYYEVKVKPGYAYRVSLQKDRSAPDSQAISDLSYKTNTENDYTNCEGSNGDFSCTVNTNSSSSIYLKVDGPGEPDSFSNYQITSEYSPVRDPDDSQEAFTVSIDALVDLTGQVTYGTAAGPSGNNFGSGASVYWVTGLKPNTHYKIRLSGLQDGTRIWVNEPMNFTSLCNAAGNAIASDIYCVIKTGNAPFGQTVYRGLALYIDNSILSTGREGTTYTLNMSEVSETDLYYFSTFSNGSTAGCPQNCERIGYTMYSEDETMPFASSITSNTPFHKKLLHISSGEKIYIRISARQRMVDAYSIQIGNSYSDTTSHSVENPDRYEANNDDVKTNATRLVLGRTSDHSLSFNDGNYRDIDWFVFTAP